jgi:hypothetical protein
MRLIAERAVLDASKRGTTIVQDELANNIPVFRAPRLKTAKYHVYSSPSNLGAEALLKELAKSHKITMKKQASLRRQSTALGASLSYVKRTSQARLTANSHLLRVTTNVDDLPYCDHMLVYLTSQTWSGGERSTLFAEEVRKAMAADMHLLLAHEMPGIGGQEDRKGCDFAEFFANEDGSTPQDLLHKGIYRQIAVPLKGSEWRKVSMIMVAQAICRVGVDWLHELKPLSSHSERWWHRRLANLRGASSGTLDGADAEDSGRRRPSWNLVTATESSDTALKVRKFVASLRRGSGGESDKSIYTMQSNEGAELEEGSGASQLASPIVRDRSEHNLTPDAPNSAPFSNRSEDNWTPDAPNRASWVRGLSSRSRWPVPQQARAAAMSSSACADEEEDKDCVALGGTSKRVVTTDVQVTEVGFALSDDDEDFGLSDEEHQQESNPVTKQTNLSARSRRHTTPTNTSMGSQGNAQADRMVEPFDESDQPRPEVRRLVESTAAAASSVPESPGRKAVGWAV